MLVSIPSGTFEPFFFVYGGVVFVAPVSSCAWCMFSLGFFAQLLHPAYPYAVSSLPCLPPSLRPSLRPPAPPFNLMACAMRSGAWCFCVFFRPCGSRTSWSVTSPSSSGTRTLRSSRRSRGRCPARETSGKKPYYRRGGRVHSVQSVGRWFWLLEGSPVGR